MTPETMPALPDPILLSIPMFVILVIAEMIYGRASGRARFETRDTATSLIMGLGNTVSGAVAGLVAVVWSFMIYDYRLFDPGFSIWAFIGAFVFYDFIYYWAHRASHRIRWFWADHVTHHSSQHYNLSTALRQPWFTIVTFKYVVFATPSVLLGFHPAMVAFVSSLNLVYQFWIHTEAIGKTPAWFEWIMNTPSHHRVHHATNPRYLDKNYAGVFIIWDKMFGTFEPERADEPCKYGIVRNLGTFNPWRVAIHEFVGIWRDVTHAKSWADRYRYMFAPPGWTPDGSRETTDMIKARWRAEQDKAAAEPAPEAVPAPAPAE